MTKQFKELKVTFVYREQNTESDALAKFASSPNFVQDNVASSLYLGEVVKVWDFCIP